jgi:hypothetical protein
LLSKTAVRLEKLMVKLLQDTASMEVQINIMDSKLQEISQSSDFSLPEVIEKYYYLESLSKQARAYLENIKKTTEIKYFL